MRIAAHSFLSSKNYLMRAYSRASCVSDPHLNNIPAAPPRVTSLTIPVSQVSKQHCISFSLNNLPVKFFPSSSVRRNTSSRVCHSANSCNRIMVMSGGISERDMAYSIAPMMDVTDRHFRSLARIISRRAVLYTEMVVDRTLIHNPRLRELELRIPELASTSLHQHPVVLQLGGSVPEELEAATRIAAPYGYSEINLNCGCPSPKVAGKGCFGAALMRTPSVVAEATRRMSAVLPPDIPVTVKCRIGVDDVDGYENLHEFISTVHGEGGVSHFIIHARKAILGGLSPAQNRSIPPLKYDVVYQLVSDFPHLRFTINGGIKTIDEVQKHLHNGIHGVMVGRGVMDRPWDSLCDVDSIVYGEGSLKQEDVMNRRKVLSTYADYAEMEQAKTGCSTRMLMKPLLNLFHGVKNGKRFRREIDNNLQNSALSFRQILDSSISVLPDEVLDSHPPSRSHEECILVGVGH